jgi:predicted ArsR family transcriptional regulator
MDLPSRPDDTLAQPTRARLFTLLAELRRPAGTEELAGRLELHPNGVRTHLERLRQAGLVTRDRVGGMRGRPRAMWQIAPEADPAGEPPNGYEQLGVWLARAIAPSRRGLREVEMAGRRIGRELAPEGGGEPEAKMHSALTSLGFKPRRQNSGSGQLTYHLCNCPYRHAVRESPEVVCSLHRGITRGLLDALAPATELAGFVPTDPDRAGCLIELRGGLAREAPAGQERELLLPVEEALPAAVAAELD